MSASPIEVGRARPMAARAAAASRRVAIIGVAIDDLEVDGALAELRSILGGPRRATLFFVNAHTLDLAARDPAYRSVLGAADLVFGDGTGVRWAARLGGVRLRANLNGTDLIPALLRAADADGRRIYLLGATPGTVAKAAEALRRQHPGWTIAGHHHGFFRLDETPRLVAAINAAAPDLLLVAMGNPLQEQWIATHRGDLAVPLVAGVGGLFAYVAGTYRRAPPRLRRLGLEWLYVLLTQSQKSRRYLIGAPRFLAAAWRRRATTGVLS